MPHIHVSSGDLEDRLSGIGERSLVILQPPAQARSSQLHLTSTRFNSTGPSPVKSILVRFIHLVHTSVFWPQVDFVTTWKSTIEFPLISSNFLKKYRVY